MDFDNRTKGESMAGPGKVRMLGEIALRVNDLSEMVNFYENVIQLELMRRNEEFAFFKIVEGFEGHTQVLALFDRSNNEGYVAPLGARTSVDHIAFNISIVDFENERERLESLGLEVTFANHGWVQWRSLYVSDPEGNVVEFVCFDKSIPVVS